MQSTHFDGLPFVSIVICTYDRKKLLKNCLESIFALDYPKSRYEVIIVDGGSTDGTEEILKDFPKIRFAVEAKFGLAYARNNGAEFARGSIVTYTDDDCIVDRYWLQNLVSGFLSFKYVAGVGGPVYPLHPEIIPRKILVNAALGLFREGENMKFVPGIVTSNSAFRQEIFKKIKFDETLGTTRRGKLVLVGEDTDFCQSIMDSGRKLLYTPFAKVYHQVDTRRIAVRYIVKHAIGNGISSTRFFLKRKHSRIWAIRFSFGMLVQCLLKMMSDRSFTSCYNIIVSLSALVVSLTGLYKVL